MNKLNAFACMQTAIDNSKAQSCPISIWRFLEGIALPESSSNYPASAKYSVSDGSLDDGSAVSFGFSSAVGLMSVNGDGEVELATTSRRVTIHKTASGAKAHLELMKGSYQAADVDGDGDVDSEEYMEFMRTQGVKI